ncbi:MAG TPA: flagellar hook assembly protein FlgD [Oleiagrimonas sp.]|nr:flagellar hook assembly protein FlgD [Oleiagrimonas sp.]
MSIAATKTIDSSVLRAINGNNQGGKSGADKLQSHFMKLLVTQLKNQNPMNPMNNAELTSQLAQINTVAGIESLNNTLDGINGQIGAGRVLQAAGLIGKGVLVPGHRVLVGTDGTTTPFGFALDRPADNVKVTITDGSGQVVRNFDLGQQPAGLQTFAWNGKLNDGTQAPEGAYSVSVSAVHNDKTFDVAGLNYALVSGISRGPDGPLLDLGGISDPVSLDDVRQIF